MEKVLAFNLDESQMKGMYKICGQMKILLIDVPASQMLKSLKEMTEFKPYKGERLSDNIPSNVISDSTKKETMIVMCSVTDKHVDKILASIRMTGLGIDYKALFTPVNKDWNGVRMLAQMAAEKRAHEK